MPSVIFRLIQSVSRSNPGRLSQSRMWGYRRSRYIMYAVVVSLALGISETRAENDTLVQDHPLREGQYLRSNNGTFIAVMQPDGNFVVYRGTSPNDHDGPLWAHNQNVGGNGPCFAVVQGDGNFVVYHGTGQRDQRDVVWSSDVYTSAPSGPYVGIMQDDGNFVVYHGRSNNDRTGVQWATNVTDPVQSFDNVTAYNYNLNQGKVTGISSVQLFRQEVANDTDQLQSSTVSGGGQTSEQSNWSDTITKTYGVKSTSEFQIPIIGGIKEDIELSYQYQNAVTNGTSSTATTQWSFTTPLDLEPHAKGVVTALVSVGAISVPYTISGTVVFQSGTRMPATISGVYTGANSYNFQVTLDPIGGGAKMTLFKTIKPIPADRRPQMVVRLAPRKEELPKATPISDQHSSPMPPPGKH